MPIVSKEMRLVDIEKIRPHSGRSLKRWLAVYHGTVERSHREDQEKFYERNIFKNSKDLEKKIRVWNDYYNNLEH